jgi:hypothetical protein
VHKKSAQYHHDHCKSNNEHHGCNFTDDIINAMGGGRREKGTTFLRFVDF